MTSLVHLSDTHFGTEQPKVVAALLNWIEQVQPDVVLVTGDITQRARTPQFVAAARFVADLRDRLVRPQLPVLIIPGNHDIALINVLERAFWPYQEFQRALGAELEPSLDTPELLVLGVNTTRRYRHKHGEVSQAQIARVAARLQSANPDQLRVVAVHQPVLVVTAKDVKNLMRRSAEAVRAWCDAGVDLILGGHIHLPYVRPLSERLKDLSRRCWAVQAGTALSSRVREGVPNSVNRVQRVDAGVWHVERWDFEAAVDRFQRRELHSVLLDRSTPG